MRAEPLVAALLLAAAGGAQAPATIVVSPDGAAPGAVRTLGTAVRRARAGDRVVVRAGTYREPTVVVDRPLTIVGEGRPTLDGEARRELLHVTASGVTVRGLRFANLGRSYSEDRAALRVTAAGGCVIADNDFDDTFYGVYLADVDGCRVEGNRFAGRASSEAASGNGIHLWSSRGVTVAGNRVAGHRDGIYLEFARDCRVERNASEGNLRYGLHFMYSDSSRYVGNVFRRNGAGVAVMYTRAVEVRGNRFEDGRGPAAYGLLLKEIGDPVVTGNVFARNTVGLMVDGATRLVAARNRFAANGWAVQLQANAQDARFLANDFAGNSFDVATNARDAAATFAGNYFDAYRGYDLDRDGRGDVPHRPVRLFALLAARHEPAVVLQRSFFVGLLDASERLLPTLTPDAVVDARPAMRPVAARAPSPAP
ncbi:nitrous oxide reductase family maturation protein NosD [Roseisolibacter sp. H3M3-2]|uniref:nitrous oxide reductase family maturation protein NosD n=1 Tax=Roseisolibacter sp. H3M3-2 TaxID=3031323 RepID=UPI0023DAB94D|nr:nitrous oxide reductase family maturation protein NosD [Roseisolibacter sp. H3M3-2]MDF1504646.1 nitrous oxide reductase family maturation protein NosD [Roseisolibacter sp. H3M3-2]